MASTSLGKNPIYFTIPISLMLHASLYAMGFKLPEYPKAPSSPALDITIVMPSDAETPEEADFIANSNQIGSGVLDEKRRIESRFAADEENLAFGTEEFTAEKSVAEIVPKIAPQVLTTKGQTETSVDKLPEEKPQEESPTETKENTEQAQAIAKLEAEANEQENDYANRPKIGFVNSLTTKGTVEAEYVSVWAKKLERIGNINFPKKALELSLSGKLVLHAVLDHAGQIQEIKIGESSGSKILDDAAIKIIKLASPFDPLPQKIREKYDRLNITRTMVFHKAVGEKAIFSSN